MLFSSKNHQIITFLISFSRRELNFISLCGVKIKPMKTRRAMNMYLVLTDVKVFVPFWVKGCRVEVLKKNK